MVTIAFEGPHGESLSVELTEGRQQIIGTKHSAALRLPEGIGANPKHLNINLSAKGICIKLANSASEASVNDVPLQNDKWSDPLKVGDEIKVGNSFTLKVTEIKNEKAATRPAGPVIETKTAFGAAAPPPIGSGAAQPGGATDMDSTTHTGSAGTSSKTSTGGAAVPSPVTHEFRFIVRKVDGIFPHTFEWQVGQEIIVGNAGVQILDNVERYCRLTPLSNGWLNLQNLGDDVIVIDAEEGGGASLESMDVHRVQLGDTINFSPLEAILVVGYRGATLSADSFPIAFKPLQSKAAVARPPVRLLPGQVECLSCHRATMAGRLCEHEDCRVYIGKLQPAGNARHDDERPAPAPRRRDEQRTRRPELPLREGRRERRPDWLDEPISSRDPRDSRRNDPDPARTMSVEPLARPERQRNGNRDNGRPPARKRQSPWPILIGLCLAALALFGIAYAVHEEPAPLEAEDKAAIVEKTKAPKKTVPPADNVPLTDIGPDQTYDCGDDVPDGVLPLGKGGSNTLDLTKVMGPKGRPAGCWRN